MPAQIVQLGILRSLSFVVGHWGGFQATQPEAPAHGRKAANANDDREYRQKLWHDYPLYNAIENSYYTIFIG